MYEKHLIESHGFRNITKGGEVIGFELGARIAYYRGVSLNIIAKLKLIVDGKPYEDDTLLVRVGDRVLSMDEMKTATDVRWEFDQHIILIGLEPGGLKPGRHTVEFYQKIKPAYMPATGFTGEASRIMTLIPTAPLSEKASRIGLGVSLYCYQEEYYTKGMSLSDCIAEVAAIGAGGVQLVAEMMMHGYPEPGDEWIENWHRLLAEHNVRPTLMDTMVDVDSGGHRNLSTKEGVEILVTQMRLAKKLGFGVIRPTTGPVVDSAPDLIEAALPYAEELDVKIAPELHAPITLQGPYVDSYLDLISRTGTKHLGFTLDMGEFCKQMPVPLVGWLERQGARPDVMDYLKQAFIDRQAHKTVVDHVATMSTAPADTLAAMRYRGFGPSTNEAEDIRAIVPYIFNVHGKFYEMNENCVEESIPYGNVLKVLVEEGYDGSIDSEFEGQRFTHDAFPTDSCEQVRRHHSMMRRELAAIA